MTKQRWIATLAAGGVWLVIDGEAARGQTPPVPPGSTPSVNHAPISWGSAGSPGTAPPPAPGSTSSRGVAGQTAHPTSAASAAQASATNVSAAAAARLRSVGLDPADAQFRAKLTARLASGHAAMLARASAKPDTLRQAPALLEAIRRLPGASRSVPAVGHALAWGGAPNPAGDGMARQVVRPNVMSVEQAGDARPLPIDRFYEMEQTQGSPGWRVLAITSTGANDLRAEKAFSVPNLYVATVTLPGGSPIDPSVPGVAHFSIPACGVDVDWPAYIAVPQSVPGLMPASAPGSGAGNGRDNGAVQFGFAPVDIGEGSGPFPVLPLGRTIHDGTMTLRWNNFRADIRAGFTGGTVHEQDSMLIGTDPPFFSSPNALGFGVQQLTFTNPAQARLNLTANAISGSDTFGIGAQLGPGYSLQTVEVVRVSSVLDQSGDAPVDDQYRGARVAFQPTAGRIQVTVNWHIGPGDSLEYMLRWTFSGPSGQRPLLTMPLRGPCDS